MDELINCLQKFDINDPAQKFDNELDLVIGQLNSIKVCNTGDVEWEMLSGNYSKLMYLCDLLTAFPLKTEKFYHSLDLFFSTLDSVNQYYLRELDWWSDEDHINNKCISVKYFLEQSLNISDQTLKMKYILNAYSIFIEIAEYYRKEKYHPELTDQEFLDEFNDDCY